MKMKYILKCILFTFVLNSWAASPDTAFCKKSSINEYEGHYSIDYLVNHAPSNQYFSDFTDWKLYIKLMEINFHGIALRENYHRSNILKPYEDGAEAFWEESTYELDYEDFPYGFDMLPKNCQYNLSKSVLVTYNSNSTIYEYDSRTIQILKDTRPLQLSFLSTRAFVKGFTDNEELISKITSAIHNQESFKQDSQSLTQLFTELLNQNPKQIDSCLKSVYIKDALEKELGTSCENITERSLKNIKTLKVSSLQNSTTTFKNFKLRHFDFSSLDNLKALDLSKLTWIGPSLFEGIFSELKNVEDLNLSKSYLPQHLTQKILHGFAKIKKLDLSYLAGSTVQFMPNAFSKIFSKGATLDLSGNRFRLKRESFIGALNIKSIIMNNFSGCIKKDTFKDLVDLRVLELEGLRCNDFNLSMFSTETLTRLEHLNIKGIYHSDSQFQLPKNLISLDISNSLFSSDGFYKDFPEKNKLEKLTASYSGFEIPFFPESMKKLRNLKTIIIDGGYSGTNISPYTVAAAAKNLPKSLKVLKICEKRIPLSYWKGWYKSTLDERPNLKIYSKNNCEGNWEELTYE